MNDDATNPDHYKRLSPEPIDVIESWSLGFALGNAIKYIARAGAKPGETAARDLAKAAWYLGRALMRAGGSPPSHDLAIELQTNITAELDAAQLETRMWKTAAKALALRARANARAGAAADPLVESILTDKPLVE